MKTRYRLFRRRGSVFYCFDNQTRLYTSLHTKDRKAAQQLVHAKNEAEAHPALCRQLGKVYLASSDPRITTRTWQFDQREAISATLLIPAGCHN